MLRVVILIRRTAASFLPLRLNVSKKQAEAHLHTRPCWSKSCFFTCYHRSPLCCPTKPGISPITSLLGQEITSAQPNQPDRTGLNCEDSTNVATATSHPEPKGTNVLPYHLAKHPQPQNLKLRNRLCQRVHFLNFCAPPQPSIHPGLLVYAAPN